MVWVTNLRRELLSSDSMRGRTSAPYTKMPAGNPSCICRSGDGQDVCMTATTILGNSGRCCVSRYVVRNNCLRRNRHT